MASPELTRVTTAPPATVENRGSRSSSGRSSRQARVRGATTATSRNRPPSHTLTDARWTRRADIPSGPAAVLWPTAPEGLQHAEPDGGAGQPPGPGGGHPGPAGQQEPRPRAPATPSRTRRVTATRPNRKCSRSPTPAGPMPSVTAAPLATASWSSGQERGRPRPRRPSATHDERAGPPVGRARRPHHHQEDDTAHRPPPPRGRATMRATTWAGPSRGRGAPRRPGTGPAAPPPRTSRTRGGRPPRSRTGTCRRPRTRPRRPPASRPSTSPGRRPAPAPPTPAGRRRDGSARGSPKAPPSSTSQMALPSSSTGSANRSTMRSSVSTTCPGRGSLTTSVEWAAAGPAPASSASPATPRHRGRAEADPRAGGTPARAWGLVQACRSERRHPQQGGPIGLRCLHVRRADQAGGSFWTQPL